MAGLNESDDVDKSVKKPFIMKHEDGRNKVKKSLADCMKYARICESTTGKEIAKVTDAFPSPMGATFHFNFNPDDIPNVRRGISIEIPAFAIMGPGELPVVPAESGVYDVSLSNGEVARANFNGSTKEWKIGKKSIGSFAQIHLEGRKFPGIIISTKRIGDVPEEESQNPDDSFSMSASAGEGLKASFTPMDDSAN